MKQTTRGVAATEYSLLVCSCIATVLAFGIAVEPLFNLELQDPGSLTASGLQAADAGGGTDGTIIFPSSSAGYPGGPEGIGPTLILF